MTSAPYLIFGEILFDCFANGRRAPGGAPFNVAWHLQALQQTPLLITRIGNDPEGAEISGVMLNWGMSMQGLQLDQQHATGKVMVSLNQGEPCFEIADQQAYDYLDAVQLPAVSGDILYHGSLALRHAPSLQALQTLKKRHAGKVFVDINLRPPWFDSETLQSWLAEADWLKLNEQELQLLDDSAAPLSTKMQNCIRRYDLQGLLLTCGADGAHAMLRDFSYATVRPETGVAVVDTVGAGDAFSAVALIGIRQGWPLSILLARAQALASAIVGHAGAIVRDRAFYQNFVENWRQQPV